MFSNWFKTSLARKEGIIKCHNLTFRHIYDLDKTEWEKYNVEKQSKDLDIYDVYISKYELPNT